MDLLNYAALFDALNHEAGAVSRNAGVRGDVFIGGQIPMAPAEFSRDSLRGDAVFPCRTEQVVLHTDEDTQSCPPQFRKQRQAASTEGQISNDVLGQWLIIDGPNLA